MMNSLRYLRTGQPECQKERRKRCERNWKILIKQTLWENHLENCLNFFKLTVDGSQGERQRRPPRESRMRKRAAEWKITEIRCFNCYDKENILKRSFGRSTMRNFSTWAEPLLSHLPISGQFNQKEIVREEEVAGETSNNVNERKRREERLSQLMEITVLSSSLQWFKVIRLRAKRARLKWRRAASSWNWLMKRKRRRQRKKEYKRRILRS